MFFFLVLIFSILVQLFFPWWAVAIPCALIAMLLAKSAPRAFIIAFLTIFVTWGVMAFWADYRNEGILSQKITLLFTLPNKYWLIGIASTIGGLIAGLASLSGYYFKNLFIAKKQAV